MVSVQWGESGVILIRCSLFRLNLQNDLVLRCNNTLLMVIHGV